MFRIISQSIQTLIQDLENACEPALTAMTKVIFSYNNKSDELFGDILPSNFSCRGKLLKQLVISRCMSAL